MYVSSTASNDRRICIHIGFMIAITKLLHLKSINAVKWQKTSKQKFKKKKGETRTYQMKHLCIIYILDI